MCGQLRPQAPVLAPAAWRGEVGVHPAPLHSALPHRQRPALPHTAACDSPHSAHPCPPAAEAALLGLESLEEIRTLVGGVGGRAARGSEDWERVGSEGEAIIMAGNVCMRQMASRTWPDTARFLKVTCTSLPLTRRSRRPAADLIVPAVADLD